MTDGFILHQGDGNILTADGIIVVFLRILSPISKLEHSNLIFVGFDVGRKTFL